MAYTMDPNFTTSKTAMYVNRTMTNGKKVVFGMVHVLLAQVVTLEGAHPLPKLEHNEANDCDSSNTSVAVFQYENAAIKSVKDCVDGGGVLLVWPFGPKYMRVPSPCVM